MASYRDSEGNFYFDPVFNETVQIVEFDEGFDTEVFFMWVFMVAGGLLVLFLGFTMLQGEFKVADFYPLLGQATLVNR